MFVLTLAFMKGFLLLAFLSVLPFSMISFNAIRVWGIGVGVVV